MINEQLLHDWMVSHLQRKLSRDYDYVHANIGDSGKHDFKGCYPDLVLGNHGLVLAIVEVETEGTISDASAAKWKERASLGAKLILMVPRHAKARVLDLLWKHGIADKASVGSYELNVQMP